MDEGCQNIGRQFEDQRANTVTIQPPYVTVVNMDVLPLDGLVLNFSILIIQRLEYTVDNLSTCVIVTGQERWRPCIQRIVEIIQ